MKQNTISYLGHSKVTRRLGIHLQCRKCCFICNPYTFGSCRIFAICSIWSFKSWFYWANIQCNGWWDCKGMYGFLIQTWKQLNIKRIVNVPCSSIGPKEFWTCQNWFGPVHIHTYLCFESSELFFIHPPLILQITSLGNVH